MVWQPIEFERLVLGLHRSRLFSIPRGHENQVMQRQRVLRCDTFVSDKDSAAFCVNRSFFIGMLALICSVFPGAATVGCDNLKREKVIKLIAQVQRADYEGDRKALNRLYLALEPFADDRDIAAKVRYWRGFAMWRRALNGFNDSASASELQESITRAVSEFEKAMAIEPRFVDAKASAGSCMALLMFLYRRYPELAPEFQEPARARALLAKALAHMNEAETEEPENPRVLWMLGPVRWNLPPERGGGQDKALAGYEKGLRAVRSNSCLRNPLAPTWGEPELLMSLAYSNLNRSKPDLIAAERYAREALVLVPYWHYVRDILLPQINKAKGAL